MSSFENRLKSRVRVHYFMRVFESFRLVIKVFLLVNRSLITFHQIHQKMLGLAASNFLLKVLLLVAILIAVISISNAQVGV